jgi:hypothetical protein
MKPNWTKAMNALLLVRLGQELGTASPLASGIHDLLDLLAAVTGFLPR